jgi:hypothetical protein
MKKNVEQIMDEDLGAGHLSFFEYSGNGPTLESTERIRKELPIIFDKLNIETLFDAPCGDLVWMSVVLKQNPELKYIGSDIVKRLVDKHNQTYINNHNINFVHLDITEDNLPKADLWNLRDCLFHLPHEMSFQTFKNFIRSDIKYLLTSSHFNDHNKDIPIRGFNHLNLFKSPFNFPEPLYRFEDVHNKEMCVWSKEQISKAVP